MQPIHNMNADHLHQEAQNYYDRENKTPYKVVRGNLANGFTKLYGGKSLDDARELFDTAQDAAAGETILLVAGQAIIKTRIGV